MMRSKPAMDGRWVALLMLATIKTAQSQEALQNMLSGDSAARARGQAMQTQQSPDYTLKEGDFRLLVVPSLGLQYNDNVNLAQTNVLDDYLVMPSIGITASYPLTQQNLLYLDFSIGYNWYLKNSQFSSFSLNSSSGTGLSFDVAIKDVTLNLHDQVNYSEGAGNYGAGSAAGNGFVGNTANGSIANTPTYGTFQNTAGLSGTWDLNQVTLLLGYDHQNVLSTSGQFNDVDHRSEMLSARAGFQVHPTVTTGLETTAAYTRYDQQILNNNDAYTVGPYVDFHPGKFLTISARGGYSIYSFAHTSTTISTSNSDSWYADLNISHQPTEFVNYSLDVGREVQLGTISDLTSDWYVRPNLTLNVINAWPVTAFFFYEHGNQGVGSTGSLAGYANGTFDWYGGGVSVQHPITSWLLLSLNYQHTERSSADSNSSYSQNLVALQLSYRLQ